MQSVVPIVKDVVLLGGGHTHLEVLRSFGMRPMPGVRLTLVTRDVQTPYSGMLPGYVAGFYTREQCHIDLVRLATFARARLIQAEANGIDTQARRVLCPRRPAVPYDVLSIDIGITPGQAGVPGAAQHAVAVKPIDTFVARFEALLQRVRAATRQLAVVVVGGGAGGVELALALAYRLAEEWAAAQGTAKRVGGPPSVTLVSRGAILASQPPSVAAKLRRLAHQQGVQLLEGPEVAEVAHRRLRLADGSEVDFDECLWCTQASAAPWLRKTGLPTDASGFLAVNEFLQSARGPPEVFAVGDVASSTVYPRPKAGVFAVRQGPALAENLRRLLTGRPLRSHVPQSTYLALITGGGRYAVGVKGWLAFEGTWAWTLKDYIDRAFMRKYGEELPITDMMSAGGGSSKAKAGRMGNGSDDGVPAAVAAAGPDALALLAAARMRCGGCGAKVGASTLARVLQRLAQQQADAAALASPGGVAAVPHSLQVLVGLHGADDAAVVEPPPPGHVSVHTVDFFRSFWDDPYVFGRIAANHALGDCYAMGAQPSSALAIAVVPFGPEAKQEEELLQLMAGATEMLAAAGATLVGGHTGEGSEVSLGFAVNGHAPRGQLMTKGGLQPGQTLVLTKPLGTGTVMAAAMRGAAKGEWVIGALESMQQSSAAAAEVLRSFGCNAATDVTGFGLLGHAVEMLRASGAQVAIELDWDALPSLPGSRECIAAGALSSLHAQNARAAANVADFDGLTAAEAGWPLLVDPQTAGGLLAAVPAGAVGACVEALRRAGYAHAAAIGRVTAAAVGEEGVQLPSVHVVLASSTVLNAPCPPASVIRDS